MSGWEERSKSVTAQGWIQLGIDERDRDDRPVHRDCQRGPTLERAVDHTGDLRGYEVAGGRWRGRRHTELDRSLHRVLHVRGNWLSEQGLVARRGKAEREREGIGAAEQRRLAVDDRPL